MLYLLQAAGLATILVLIALGLNQATFIALLVTCGIVAIGVLVKLFKPKKRF